MTVSARIVVSAGLSVALALGTVAANPIEAKAASCVRYYWVDQVPAPVRENPNSRSVVRKYKSVFDTVTAPCRAHVADKYSSRVYVAVYTRAASDGIGWMSTGTLQRAR